MYSLRILRRAVKDIADLPKGYVSLVSEHIERLGQNPRPQDAKKLKGTADYTTGRCVSYPVRHRR